MNRVEVGILGATGMVGQHFIRFLEKHPWFAVTWLGASERSAGKVYQSAAKWNLSGTVPSSVADMVVSAARTGPVSAHPEASFFRHGCFGGNRDRTGLRASWARRRVQF